MNETDSAINYESTRMDKRSELSSRENKDRDLLKEFTPTTNATNVNPGQRLLQGNPFSYPESEEGASSNWERLEHIENDCTNNIEKPTISPSHSPQNKEKKGKELLYMLISPGSLSKLNI